MSQKGSQSDAHQRELSDKEKWENFAPNERAAAALALNSFFTEAYAKIDVDQSFEITRTELRTASTNKDLSLEQRQSASFIDKHFEKFSDAKGSVDAGRVKYFSKQVATHSRESSDLAVANGLEESLLKYGRETGVTQSYYLPGVQQDAKRLSSWIQSNFAKMDLDKDGQVEWKEMDKLEETSDSLSHNVEFKVARKNWHELTHLVELGEGSSGFSLKDAKALNEAFDPSAKPLAYESWKQENLSSQRLQSFGPFTSVSTAFVPFMAAGAFAGPPGWIFDAAVGGFVALGEAAIYLADYRPKANLIKARTAENYYEYSRREIISKGILSDLHNDAQTK